jgi:sugar phosphate permease
MKIRPTGIVFLLLCAMYALNYIARNDVSTAASVFGKDLQLSNAQVGFVFSAFAYPYLIFQVIGGWIGDRFGARLALAASTLIWAAATVLTGLAPSFGLLVAARLLLGFGEGASLPAATRAMSDWISKDKRALVQGVTHSSARLGNALTPILISSLMLVTSWRGSFVMLGVVSFAWALAWWFYFRDDPADHPSITPEELKRVPERQSAGQRGRVPWKRLIIRMLPVTGVYFCYGWTLWLYLAWIPLFFLHHYGLNLKNSAWFSTGVFFAGVIGDTLGGVLSDRVYARTRDRNRARRNLVVIGFILSLAFMVPLLYVSDIRWAAACLSCAFFFSEFTTGPMWAIPMDIAPRFSGSASGLMNAGSALAAILSPIVFGSIVDKTGSWSLPFTVNIGLLLFGAVLSFWMRPNQELEGAGLHDLPLIKHVVAVER